MSETIPDDFDPYYLWLGIPPEEQPPNHYRLLAVRLFEANADVIATAADQRMAHLRTFQTGPNGRLSQKLLNEVAAAKVCLLNADKKAAYDAKLEGEMTPVDILPKVKPVVVSEGPLDIRIEPEDRRLVRARPSTAKRKPKWHTEATMVAAAAAAMLLTLGIAIWIANRPGPESETAESQPDEGTSTIAQKSTVRPEPMVSGDHEEPTWEQLTEELLSTPPNDRPPEEPAASWRLPERATSTTR